MHLGRKLLHTANDELEFMRQRLGLGKLLTVGFDMRNALTQSDHARLDFLCFHKALGIAIDQPCQALAELAHLGLQGGTLLPLPLSIGVEATGKLLGQPFGMRQEGTHFLPSRQLEAIRPHWGVGTEALAAKAIGIHADTPVIGLGPGPTLPCTGTQGVCRRRHTRRADMEASPAADRVPNDATGGHAGGFPATAPAPRRTPWARRWRARGCASSLGEVHHRPTRPAVTAAVGPAAPAVGGAAALAVSSQRPHGPYTPDFSRWPRPHSVPT
jgi:hypothetical protein